MTIETTHLCILWVSLSLCAATSNVQTEKSLLTRISDDFWITQETFSPVHSHTACNVIASRRREEYYYHSYDKDNKECLLGKALVNQHAEQTEASSGGRTVSVAPHGEYSILLLFLLRLLLLMIAFLHLWFSQLYQIGTDQPEERV